jgi:hypothetical protein
MKYRLFHTFILMMVYSTFLVGQNLVPNPSFEDLGTQQITDLLADTTTFNQQLDHWFSPSDCTPDIVTPLYSPNYFHSNLSYGLLPPFDGKACTAILAFPQICPEFIGVKLLEPLEINTFYKVSFHLGVPKKTRGKNNISEEIGKHFGILFSEEKLAWTKKAIPASLPTLGCKDISTAVDGWKEISFIYQADSPHQYLYVGHFSHQWSLNVRYFFIDLISVEKIALPSEKRKR